MSFLRIRTTFIGLATTLLLSGCLETTKIIHRIPDNPLGNRGDVVLACNRVLDVQDHIERRLDPRIRMSPRAQCTLRPITAARFRSYYRDYSGQYWSIFEFMDPRTFSSYYSAQKGYLTYWPRYYHRYWW